MSLVKIPLPESVLQASQQRIQWVLENFSRICISFSGGKDSTTDAAPGGALRPANGEKNSACCLLIGRRNFPAPFSIAKISVPNTRML